MVISNAVWSMIRLLQLLTVMCAYRLLSGFASFFLTWNNVHSLGFFCVFLYILCLFCFLWTWLSVPMPLIAWKQSSMKRSVTDRARIVYGSVFVTVRCPSVCLTHLSTAACRCSGFAAVGQAVSTAFSSDCEQCHVVSWRRMLSTDLFTEWIVKRCSFTDFSAFQMHLHGNIWELQEPKYPEGVYRSGSPAATRLVRIFANFFDSFRVVIVRDCCGLVPKSWWELSLP